MLAGFIGGRCFCCICSHTRSVSHSGGGGDAYEISYVNPLTAGPDYIRFFIFY